MTTPLDSLRIAADGEGARLAVRAQPGARRRGVVGIWNDALKVAVRAPAQDGRANEELLEVLAEAFHAPLRSVRLVRGERSQLKEVRLDASPDEVRARIALLLSSAPEH